MEGALQDGAENYAETPLQLAAAAGDLKRAAGEAGSRSLGFHTCKRGPSIFIPAIWEFGQGRPDVKFTTRLFSLCESSG